MVVRPRKFRRHTSNFKNNQILRRHNFPNFSINVRKWCIQCTVYNTQHTVYGVRPLTSKVSICCCITNNCCCCLCFSFTEELQKSCVKELRQAAAISPQRSCVVVDRTRELRRPASFAEAARRSCKIVNAPSKFDK